MKLGLIIFILVIIAVFCYTLYKDMTSKHTKQEENFGGFMKVKLDLKMRSHLYILMFMMALVRVRLILLDNT